MVEKVSQQNRKHSIVVDSQQYLPVHKLGKAKVDRLGDDRPRLAFGNVVLRHDKVTRLGKGIHQGLVGRRRTVYITRVGTKRFQIVGLCESAHTWDVMRMSPMIR